MQNKENTCLTHFGRLRKKADRITAAAILSSAFTINYACGNKDDDKADTSELQSQLAKVKKEAEDKEKALKSQISTLEDDKITLEGEKTTKTTAITNLIGFVNALGGKPASGGSAADMAGLHSKGTISENDCSLAHTEATAALKPIYDELSVYGSNAAAQTLSALQAAIAKFYGDSTINADYDTTKALAAPSSDPIFATNVEEILKHIKGLIAHLTTEKNAAEDAKTEHVNALVSIEQELQIATASPTLSDRVNDCKTKINNLKTASGTPYATVLGELINAGHTITKGKDETSNKNALESYVLELKNVYALVPGASTDEKIGYLNELENGLKKIVNLYKSSSTAYTDSTEKLGSKSLEFANTIDKLVDDVNNSKEALEYIYNLILAPQAGAKANTKTLDLILATIKNEVGTGGKLNIENLKTLGLDFLKMLKSYVADKTLSLKDKNNLISGDHDRDTITMEELNFRLGNALPSTGPSLLAEASYSKLFKELVPLTKKLTNVHATELAIDLRTNAVVGQAIWPAAGAVIANPTTDAELRNNLLATFVACRTLDTNNQMPDDNHQIYKDLADYFNNCAFADKLVFIQKIISKL